MSEGTVALRPGNAVGTPIASDADLMNINYADLANSGELFKVPGWDLVDQKDQLLGVPFIIVGLTFQMPVKDKANPFGERDFVTCRAIIGNREALTEALQRHWTPNDRIAFNPEERICFNDGSTGIRRDVVKMLESVGLIDVGNDDHPNRFDAPWTQWVRFDQAVQQGENVVPDFSTNHLGNLLTIHARRGLRKSEYTNEYGDGVTYYL